MKIKRIRKLLKFLYYKVLCTFLNPKDHGLDPYKNSPTKRKLTGLVPGNRNSAVCLSVNIEMGGHNYGAWLKRRARLKGIDCIAYKRGKKKFEAILIGPGLKLEDMLLISWKGSSTTRVANVKAKWFNRYVRKGAKGSKNFSDIPWSTKTAGCIRNNLKKLSSVLEQSNQFEGISEKGAVEIEKVVKEKGYFVLRSASSNYVVSPNKVVGIQYAENANVPTIVRAATNDKHLTKEILAYNGLPVPKGAVFVHYQDAKDYLSTCGYPMVVKPLEGSLGKGITVDVRTKEHLKVAWDYAKKVHESVILEELVYGVDVRILVMGGSAYAALMRVPANVVGDGEKSVETLIFEKNKLRLKNPRLDKKLIKLDPYSHFFLERQGHSVDSIPDKGEIVFMHLKANLAAGGDSIVVTEFVNPDLMALAEEASLAFRAKDFWGIDLLVEDITLPRHVQNCKIVEVNSRAGLRGVQYPLYGKPTHAPQALIDRYFPEDDQETDYPEVSKSFKVTGSLDSGLLEWASKQAQEIGIKGNIGLVNSEAHGVVAGREDRVLNFFNMLWAWQDVNTNMAVDGLYIDNFDGTFDNNDFTIKEKADSLSANLKGHYSLDLSVLKINEYGKTSFMNLENTGIDIKLYIDEFRRRGYKAEAISNELISTCKGSSAGVTGVYHSSSYADNVCDRILPAKNVLALNSIPVQRGLRFNCKRTKRIADYFDKLGKPCFVTFMHPDGYNTHRVCDAETLKTIRKSAVKKGVKFLLLEDYPPGAHVCIAVVNSKAVSSLAIEPTLITGDGKSNIKELIEEINDFRRQNPCYMNNLIVFDDKLLNYLGLLNCQLEDVLSFGEKIYLDNAGTWGGDTIVVDGILHDDFKEKAVLAVQAIPGLKFAFVHMAVPCINQPADAQEWVVTKIDTKPPVAAFHYPWKGESFNLAGAVISELCLNGAIPVDCNLEMMLVNKKACTGPDINTVIDKVKRYHDRNERLYPLGKRFHYNTRMFLLTGADSYFDNLQSIKDKWIKEKQWFVKKAKAIPAAKYISRQLDVEKLYRDKALKNHYKVGQYNSIFFRALFQECFYDEVLDLQEFIDKNDVRVVRDNLLKDGHSLVLLSTIAINFLYHYKYFIEDGFLEPELLLNLGQTKLDVDAKSRLHALIYYYTHAIIGESRFYTREIENHKDVYREMIEILEKMTVENYDKISLDQKFEIIVCANLLGVDSAIREAVEKEAVQSLSDEGLYLIDKLNEYADKGKTSFSKSEHRNVLGIMAFYRDQILFD